MNANPLVTVTDTIPQAAGWLWPLIIGGGLGVVLVVAILLIRRHLQTAEALPQSLQYTVLAVLLPKYKEEDKEKRTDWRETLAALETLFVTIASITIPHASGLVGAWDAFWHGQPRTMVFEIAVHGGYIHFYLAVPRTVQSVVEMQIQAQYPDAQVTPTTEYNIFHPHAALAATTLKLTKGSMFPLRTYKRLDTDPLNAITNVLSKLSDDEGAVIQIVLRPKKGGWGKSGQHVAQKLQEGKKLKEAVGSGTNGGAGFLFSSLRGGDSKTPAVEKAPIVTPMAQELIKSLEEKASKPGFDVNIRILATSPHAPRVRPLLENIVSAFSQFQALESGNGFVAGDIVTGGEMIRHIIYRRYLPAATMTLNSEEVNSIFHFPLPETDTPNILWLPSKKAPAPLNMPPEGLILGTNAYRGVTTTVRIKPADRRRHVYIIGTTGSGKTVLMQEMAKQDIAAGHGVCIIDPHGGMVEDILACIPKERMHDVILFDPADEERPVGLNMLEASNAQERDFAVQEMIAIFYKIVSDPAMLGPMFEHNMRNAMLTIMEDKEYPGTIVDIPRIFTDKSFQQYKLTKVTDPIVRQFWEQEMAKTSDFHKSEMLGYLISKVGRFVENRMMRNIIGQAKSGFNIRQIMDERKILLCNLSKGKLGEINSNLIGLILVSKLQMAALARADIPEDQRADFYLYIDEFQNYVTDSIATILSEARKYKLNLTMAHQYMGQLAPNNDPKVRDAVLGNVGTMIAFRIGPEDAELLAKQFAPTISAYDLMNPEKYTAYIRLLIDNMAAPPFNIATQSPSSGYPAMAQAIREYSRLRFGKDRSVIEAEILERSKLGAVAAAQPNAPLGPSR